MQQLIAVLCALIVLCKNGKAAGEFTPTGHSVHINDGNFSEQLQHHQAPLHALPGPAFNLKVQVNDLLNRQYLSQALVEVYINYTRNNNTALTGDDGVALLHVPYKTGLPFTIVASKEGYICALLPCKTTRMPIFSVVTMSLVGRNQGNIWFYEDSVLITGRTSDASKQPVVQFPKKLLNLTDSGDIASVKAYLTLPKLTAEDDSFVNTLGIVSSKSGYISVELRPVAAVSVQLFSRGTELHVNGPVQISLTIPDNCGLHASNVVPAWFFNQTTGGWMRKGLGMVVLLEGKLTWTFTAPHLGYWIAAPLSSTRGFLGITITDFILQYSSHFMVFLGGMLIVICVLVGWLYRRSSISEATAKKIHATNLPAMTKDQTTSTCDSDLFEVSSGESSNPQDELNQLFTEKGDNQHNTAVISMQNADVIAKPGLGKIHCTELEFNADLNDLTCSQEISQQIEVPASLTENLYFYNQPVAILHAPAFFHLEEQENQPQWSKSATLPRAGASNNLPTEPPSKDSYTQTLSKAPSPAQNQEVETEDQVLAPEGSQAATSTNLCRGHHGLPESMSVPGTLNKVGDSSHSRLTSELQGNSEHALAELSKIPSPQPPRAWFVSLEGRPAAEIHYAVSEQQRRRRPAESRETSLDSGVDMNELNQTGGRRTVTLERNATFVKSTTSSKHRPAQ
ncbi:hypothetical protein LDENG_00287220 [Lucifuga dentata]|nr:hypothetical protein LDENG_00287220 [Lucifuga dentata]